MVNISVTETARQSNGPFPVSVKKMAAAAAKGAVGALVINPSQETFSQRSVNNGKKTGVYYPRNNEGCKTINFAMLSHEFAKNIIGNNFDTLLKISKLTQVPWINNGQWEKKLKV